MNPKTKSKVAIDIVMSTLLLALMNLAWTGLMLHELLGLGIVVLFAIHLLLNRQWISSVARRFRDIASQKTRFMLVLNILLGLTMLATVASGILISQNLFPGQADIGFDLWFGVHSVASWLSLGIVTLHTAIHWRWIGNVIRRLVPAGQPGQLAGRLRVLAARAVIGIFAVVTVYSLVNGQLLDLVLPVSAIDKITGSASGEETTTGTSAVVIVEADETDTTTVTIQTAPTAEATEAEITLQQYLGNLVCTACHKHCLLSSPRCARGVRQADTASDDYYEALENGTL